MTRRENRRRVERGPIPTAGSTEEEFGVPIAGVILPRESWARTALKKLPEKDESPVDWSRYFGRKAPLVLDIGCGNGRFLLASAVARPQCDHIGLDILPVVIRYATRRANQRGLANIRFAVIGGREFLCDYVLPASIAEIHCYHPQPYYNRHEIQRRLITPEFLALCHRSLVPEGKLFLQTDNPGYWRYMTRIVPIFFEWAPQSGPWPDAPLGRTRREIIARREGLPVFRGVGSKRSDVHEIEAMNVASRLPPPTFDASRRHKRLDELERQAR